MPYYIFETLGNEDSGPCLYGPYKTVEQAEKEFYESGEGYMTGTDYILFKSVVGEILIFSPVKHMRIPDCAHEWQELETEN